MAFEGPRFQLWMELASEEPRMAFEFHYLDQRIVGRRSGGLEAGLLERRAISVVDFIAMAMALRDPVAPVERTGNRAGLDHARIRAQAHRAALLIDVLLLFHDVDNRVGRALVDFARVGALEPQYVARVLDHHHLQAKTDTENRHSILTRVPHRA